MKMIYVTQFGLVFFWGKMRKKMLSGEYYTNNYEIHSGGLFGLGVTVLADIECPSKC